MLEDFSIKTLPFVLFAAATPGMAAAAEGSEAVRCEVRSTAVPGGVRLQPVAIASAPASGTYAFVATSRAAGGTSKSSQSGTFDLEADEEHVLGTTTLGLGENASYRARLTVRWDDREASCGAEYPSDR